MTLEEMKEAGTHPYPDHGRAQIFHATVTALRTLGYQVVVADSGNGKIKTAPKLVTAVAHGNAYSAVATENSVAWNVHIVPSSKGAVLHAEPRGYSGGQAVDPTRMNASYMERLFATLYQEIDNNLSN